MPIQLQLRSSQMADLAEIRDSGPDKLHAIAERLRNVTPRPMQPKELHSQIAQVLGDKPEAASRILRPLLSLQAIIRQRRLSADEVVEAVRQGLESSERPWKPTELDRWRLVEPSFKQLLLSPTIRLVSITLDLTYEYENLLQGARVVTDIRPVFSEDATQIEGAVISHTLRLRYDSTEGNHSLSIAMDERDIRELERQCQRALLKAETARALMATRANVPTAIAGDGGNAEE